MRPKNLNPPLKLDSDFLNDDDRILFLTQRGSKDSIPNFFEKKFLQSMPIHLEFCSGNGEWIVQKALDHPDILWVAVEKQFKRVRKIWSKMKNLNLSNLWIICGEAFSFSNSYLPSESLDHIYINFPDPWPKNKHAKFRLINSPFTTELLRLLKTQGTLDFVTDDPSYSQSSIECFMQQEGLEPLFKKPFFHSDLENYGTSYFKRLWEEKKRSFYFSKFKKTCKHEKVL